LHRIKHSFAFLKHAKVDGTKIIGYPYKIGKTCAPILEDTLSYLECKVDQPVGVMGDKNSIFNLI
jgi:flavin reductase (DIM6/NTAB) family NADH-FMN oxidoreductase RutF